MPGKFPDEIAERLWDITLENGQDDDVGDVSEYGFWAALILETEIEGTNARNFIIEEDEQGFISYQVFDSQEAAEKKWAAILELIDKLDEGMDAEDAR